MTQAQEAAIDEIRFEVKHIHDLDPLEIVAVLRFVADEITKEKLG